MKSSSALFPVSLIATETRGAFNEDVYELRAGIAPDRSVRVTVSRITHGAAFDAQKTPLVLLHPEFENHRYWFSANGTGLAARLAKAGFDVWLPNARGHGFSKANDRWLLNNLSDTSIEDLPAINAFVFEQTRKKPIWMAAGVSAMALAYALVETSVMRDKVAAACFMDVRGRLRLNHKGGLLARRAVSRFWLKRHTSVEGPLYGLGPENEPAALFLELLDWQRSKKHPVLDRVKCLQMPLLILCGEDKRSKSSSSQKLYAAMNADYSVMQQVALPKANTTPGQTLDGHPFIGSLKLHKLLLSWIELGRSSTQDVA